VGAPPASRGEALEFTQCWFRRKPWPTRNLRQSPVSRLGGNPCTLGNHGSAGRDSCQYRRTLDHRQSAAASAKANPCGFSARSTAWLSKPCHWLLLSRNSRRWQGKVNSSSVPGSSSWQTRYQPGVFLMQALYPSRHCWRSQECHLRVLASFSKRLERFTWIIQESGNP
jgi:hypothetical protein